MSEKCEYCLQKSLHGNHVNNVGPGKASCRTEKKLRGNGVRGGKLKIYT